MSRIGILFPDNEKARQVGADLSTGLINLGHEVQLEYAEDMDMQEERFSYLWAYGFDLIIFWAIEGSNPELLVENVSIDYGIIAFETPIDNADVVTYSIGFDYYGAGAMQAQYVLNGLENTDEAVIRYFIMAEENWKIEKVLAGAMETFANSLNEPISEDEMEYVSGNDKTEAKTQMSTLLAENGNTYDAIYCCTDEIAQGVVEAYTEAEIPVSDMPIITGFGGSDQAKANIAAGLQTMTVVPDYDSAVERAIQVADSLCQGLDIADWVDEEIDYGSGTGIPSGVIGTIDISDDGGQSSDLRELIEITIDKQPNKTQYYVNEKFDRTGMVVTAHYNDGTSRQVTAYTVDPSGELEIDDSEITITYSESGKTETATVQIVVRMDGLDRIEITRLPNQTKYLSGAEFDKTGMKAKVFYQSGREKEVLWTELEAEATLVNLSAEDEVVGNSVAVIYHERYMSERSTTLTVQVAARIPKELAVITKPKKTNYVEGEKPDIEGIKAEVTFPLGIVREVAEELLSADYSPLDVGAWVEVSYTEQDVEVKTSFSVNVRAKDSANARINQSKLSYPCGAGEGYVNISSGTPEFLTATGISIGANDYCIDAELIYRGQGFDLPNSLESSVGADWKLTLQEYLFEKDGRYIYLDGKGDQHVFEFLEEGKYYDTSGLGLILTLGTEEHVISDQFENKMYFANERLTSTESCYNKNVGRSYCYYDNGKLKSVWERGNIGSKLRFVYSDVTGLLSEIRYEQNYVTKKTFHFYYDTSGNLIRISRSVGTETREVAMFRYGTSAAESGKLLYAVNSETLSAIRFEYETGEQGRVSEVSVGRVSADFAPDSAAVNFTKKSENTFVYGTQSGKHYYTAVTNEKGIKAVYYLNAEGITTSILEANAGDMNDLRSLEKRAGLSVMENDDGSSSEKINCCNVKVLSEGEKWSRNVSKDSQIDRYRRNKYHACSYFSFSFWLKITGQVSDEPRVKFTVYSDDGDTVDTGNAYYDDTAENAWQLITVPVKISEQYVNKLELTVEGAEEYRVADIKFIVDQSIQFYIRSDNDSAPLEEFDVIKFKRPGADNYTEKMLSDKYYMSEKDLQATYYSMARSENNCFVLSLCDNTERHLVTEVKLHHTGKGKDFALDLPSDGLARFYQQMKSSDGKTKITGNIYFGKDEQGTPYTGICQVTLAEGKDENENNISSSSCTYVDYKGLLQKERDEYGVETVYAYDSRGRLTQKTLRSDETDETLVFTATQTSTALTEQDPTSELCTTFDGLFGTTGSTQYKGKAETSNILTTTYAYDTFNERLTGVSNNVLTADAAGNSITNGNTLTYDENGRLKKVMTTGYGYAFEYDDWGNLSKTSLVEEAENGTVTEQMLAENTVSYTEAETTDKKYRALGQADETVSTLDKYGRTDIITQKNYGETEKETTFTRQTLSESAGAAEVTEMYDPYEDRTYVYSYDDANNCTGYTVKTGTGGANFFSVKKTGENAVTYDFGQTNYESTPKIIEDENVLLSPRVAQIKLDFVYFQTDAGDIRYCYDHLGRIKKKTHNLQHVFASTEHITETTKYVYGTCLKEEVETELSGGPATLTHKYSYEYNQRGLPSKIVYKFADWDDDALNEIYTNFYFYDKAGRLTTETHRSGDNVQSISYSYNADGSLQKEMMGSLTHRQYVYNKGRLTSYLDKDGNPLATFSYDNLGNCTGYETDEKEVSMEWERGSLMTKFERTETENGTEKSTEATYFYNSRKVRYKKIVNETMTSYYYDGGKLEAEYDGNAEVEAGADPTSRVIRYLYDSEGIVGIAVLHNHTVGGNYLYHFIKDGQGNVTGLIDYDRVIARYEYDTWGKCKVLNPDGTENTNENFIGNINPIRWKGQYYDRESGMYYIGGRYYDPDIKRYISAVNPEEMLNRAGTVYGINPYLLTLTNPVNMVYNEYTIEPDGELSYDPDELDNFNYFWRYTWTKFWNSKLGKYIAVRLFVAATALAILCPAFAPTYLSAVVGIGLSLGVGSIIAGIRSRRQGNGFWSGFVNHLSENWSQELAIGMTIALLTFGISQAVRAISKVGPHCFAAGTLVACRKADGEEIHKPIEEIEVGDEVLSYDEKTGEQGYKPVVRLFRNQTKEWYHVFVDEEEIKCTGEHPFYVKGKGFIPAKGLKSGDKCLLSTGEDVTIEKVEVENLTEAETTYNFEVADFHTYYVTEKDVLVHNKCGEILDKVPDGYEPTYKNGVYDPNPKHGRVQHGRSSAGLSREYGQYALDNAIPYPNGGKALYAYNGKNIIQLMPSNSAKTVWHGFIVNNLSEINGKAANWLRHYFKIK